MYWVWFADHQYGIPAIKQQEDMDRVKRIWYLSPMRAAKVQASLRIRAVSPEPSLLAHTSSESRGPFRQKARSLAPLNGWACAVKICHDGMLEDTNSLDGAHIMDASSLQTLASYWLCQDRQDVRFTKTVCWTDCWTDHRMVVSKLNLRIQLARWRQERPKDLTVWMSQTETRQQEKAFINDICNN